MPWCPNCKAEYDLAGIVTCKDCGIPLVAELPEAPPQPEPVVYRGKMTQLTTVNDDSSAAMLESFLKEQGIPVLRKYKGAGQYASVVFGYSAYGVQLWVPEDALEQARDFLQLLEEEYRPEPGQAEAQTLPAEPEYELEAQEPTGFATAKKTRRRKRGLTVIILLFVLFSLTLVIVSGLVDPVNPFF